MNRFTFLNKMTQTFSKQKVTKASFLYFKSRAFKLFGTESFPIT